ncbi:hypothetical protein HMPREF1211_02749 [Streptomyces sp. HGB0020]|jgi:hypothetical protein|nr:hypothetical protein HMPREF1211_02749 [Streptomyces sp. HGB0020]
MYAAEWLLIIMHAPLQLVAAYVYSAWLKQSAEYGGHMKSPERRLVSART